MCVLVIIRPMKISSSAMQKVLENNRYRRFSTYANQTIFDNFLNQNKSTKLDRFTYSFAYTIAHFTPVLIGVKLSQI